MSHPIFFFQNREKKDTAFLMMMMMRNIWEKPVNTSEIHINSNFLLFANFQFIYI